MISQQQTWYSTGGDIVARAAFSLAMCGALAGLLYVTAHNGSAEMSTASAAGATSTATVLASIETNPSLSKSQAAIDASPTAMPVAANIPIPVARVAVVTAVAAKRPALPLKRPAPEAVAVASNVVRFDSCLPGCESHDPLLTGHAETPREPAFSPSPSDELVQRVSLSESRPSILGRAMDAPGFVYRRGRSALTTLVRAAL